jgi:putative transposase
LFEQFEISPSSYHHHRQRRRISRGTTTGRVSNDALLAHIKAIHVQFKGEYSWPHVWKELLANGVRVGKERVRRPMAQHGIKAYTKRKLKATTNSAHDAAVGCGCTAHRVV